MAEAGYVYASVKLDDADAVKELTRLKKKIEDVTASLNEKKARRTAIEEEMKSIEVQTEAARKRVEELKAALAAAPKGEKAGIQADLKEATAEYSAQMKQMDALNREWQKLDGQITTGEKDLERMEGTAAGLTRQIAATDSVAAKAATAIQKAGKRMENVFARVKRAVERVFLYSVISMGLRAMREYMTEVIKSSPEAAEALGRLKGALLTLVQPLMEVVIPAFTALVNVIADVITAVASLVATLSGSTIEATQESAEALYNQAKGLDAVGNSAKKASKQLLGFDEINKLDGDSSGSSGSSSSNAITPIFGGQSGENGWLNNLLNVVYKLRNVVFEWDNVTPYTLIQKIAAAVFGIAGGIIGWNVGGISGAAVGVTLGASLGVIIADVIFNGSEEVNEDTVIKALVVGLNAVAGAAIGFGVGGINGAAIGLIVGAGIGIVLEKMMFETDQNANAYTALNSMVTALLAFVGGVIGITLGGVGGAVLGVSVGASVGLYITNSFFSAEWVNENKELVATLCVALGAIAGGLIGFNVGGAAGAVVGAFVGVGVMLSLESALFTNNKGIQTVAIAKALATVLTAMAGGAIGFVFGGPAGALLGVTLGVGISLVIQSIDWSSDLGKLLKDALITMPAMGITSIINGIKVPGLATGAVIPPNREFLAVLGDQTSGTNIEAPLDTILEAFRMALAENGGGKSNVTIEFTGSLAQLGRVLHPVIKDENQRVGVGLVEGA